MMEAILLLIVIVVPLSIILMVVHTLKKQRLRRLIVEQWLERHSIPGHNQTSPERRKLKP
ncbi:MAG: hypothetical protein V1738_02980 [Patescibacteria group bacterium]